MPNANLLVAGTGGITFDDNHGNDIGYPVVMKLGIASDGLLGRTAREYVPLLSMEHKTGQIAPVKTSLAPGISLHPGHVLKVAYNQVPSSFSNFLYDWRCDLRYTASQLLKYLRKNKPVSGKWNIVGHSQGALLIVLASKLLPNRDSFMKMVRSVILVGAPLAGTVNSARALILGDQFGKAASPDFKKILRTWPSLYQMVPAWNSVVNRQGNELPADKQLNGAKGWDSYPSAIPDWLDRTDKVQELLKNPFGFMSGVQKKAILLARNRHTRVKILSQSGKLDTDKLKRELGDTLVPHDRTLNWVGQSIWSSVKTFNSPCNEHSMLLNDPTILGTIRQLIR